MTTATKPAASRWHELDRAVDVAWRRLDGLLCEAAGGGSRVPEELAERIEDASIYYDMCVETMREFEARRRRAGRRS